MNIIKNLFTLIFITLLSINGSSQGFVIEGYTYETGNRGFLSQVDIEVIDNSTGQVLSSLVSKVDGFFSVDLPPVGEVLVKFNKEMFKASEQIVVLKEGKTFIKAVMERAPGYLFEITLADMKEDGKDYADAITGALIEVYNNTTEKLVQKLENHPHPEFKLAMEKGNHYTILVRKKGYLAKQMEAYVNVGGCILCFEGINKVTPGVTENLTAGNEYGTLLANVEMDKIYSGKSFNVNDLLYDLNSALLKTESKKELDKVINVLRYNPNLTLELGSHTDSRGKNLFNMKLSKERALSAVKYITDVGGIPKFKIIAAGYGETMLLNKCGDGVICSEADHAKNRRTEIKIIGIDQDWIFKPLENIKNEIKMEKEIYEMIHGKPEKLTEAEYKKKKALEKSSSLPISSSKPVNNNDDIVIFEAMDENITEAEAAGEQERLRKIQEKKQAVIDKKKAAFDKESAILTAKEESIAKIKKAYLDSIEMKNKIKEPINEKLQTKDNLENMDQEIVEEVIQDMPNDEVIDPTPRKNRISDGYKIIIHFAGIPLDQSNPLFEQYKKLETYVSPDNNYYYMLPGYDSTVEAEKALKEGLIAVYPSAYVAGFKGGRRIL